MAFGVPEGKRIVKLRGPTEVQGTRSGKVPVVCVEQSEDIVYLHSRQLHKRAKISAASVQ